MIEDLNSRLGSFCEKLHSFSSEELTLLHSFSSVVFDKLIILSCLARLYLSQLPGSFSPLVSSGKDVKKKIRVLFEALCLSFTYLSTTHPLSTVINLELKTTLETSGEDAPALSHLQKLAMFPDSNQISLVFEWTRCGNPESLLSLLAHSKRV